MKYLPKDDLVALIDAYTDGEVASENTVSLLFREFGDDYYMEHGGKFELCQSNEKREQFLKSNNQCKGST